jgi:hypothetical protein
MEACQARHTRCCDRPAVSIALLQSIPRRGCTYTDDCEWMLSCIPFGLLLLLRPSLVLLLLSGSKMIGVYLYGDDVV